MRWRPLDRRHRDRLEALRELPAHELLGVRLGAPPDEVRRAFRSKARAYHPDRLDPFLKAHGEEVMKLLNRAYRRLLAEAPR